MRTVRFEHLGSMNYQSAWDYQEQLLKENVDLKSRHRINELRGLAETKDHLLFVQHPAVYTLGKSGHLENLLLTEDELLRRGIEFFKSNRGGDITFHGPGQIVGYPILDLEYYQTDIGKYLRNLEEVIIKTIAHFGIKGERSSGETGVWLDVEQKGRARKICAMGVRCSRWITMHGFALNVNTDLEYFSNIVPCGIADKGVTSIEAEVGAEVSMQETEQLLLEHFEEVFDVKIEKLLQPSVLS
jgi:lipoyl(octanoyl) transferase